MINNRLFSSLRNNNLLKVASWTSIATLIKMIATLVMSKILSAFVGPSGIAILGQLWNSVTLFTTIASGGLNTGIIKYTAEYPNNSSFRKNILDTAFGLTIIFSFSTSIGLLVFSSFLSKKLFNSEQYKLIFIVLGLTITFAALNNFLISFINGHKDYKLYSKINIANSIGMLIVSITLTLFYNLYGALLATVLFQSIVFFISIIVIGKKKFNYISQFNFKIKKEFLLPLFSYSLTALLPAIIIPVSQIIIRNNITSQLSIESAGLWESINRISLAYLLFFTSTIGVYYFPRLSEITDIKILKQEIIITYKIIMPLMILTALLIYIFRVFIIELLFSKAFIGIQHLFFWQLLGDIMKLASWIVAFVLIAKKQIKSYLILEFTFNLINVFLCYYLVSLFSLKGASIAYFINYLLYFVITSLITIRFLHNESKKA